MIREEGKENSPAFERDERGYNIKGWYEGGGKDGKDGLIRLTCPDGIVKDLPCLSYKIWNFCAHFGDIIDGDIAKNNHGIRMAASTGLELGTIIIMPKKEGHDETR